MLIEYSLMDHFEGGSSLSLTCKSFDVREFDSLLHVFRRAGMDVQPERTKAEDGRISLRFILHGDLVTRFQRALKLDFRSYKNVSSSGSSPFRCERISVLSQPRQCKTIFADDQHAANVICALVASDNRWFGSVAYPGQCKLSLVQRLKKLF